MNPIKIMGIILIVISPLLLNGQNSESQTSKKLSFGVNFSPDYTYRRLYQGNDERNLVDIRNEMEEPRLGFTTGLAVKYQVRKQFAVESGIQFSDRGEKMEMNFDWNIPSVDFIVDPAIPQKFKSFYHYYYLGLPIKLNYYFLQKQFKFFISGGVLTDFFLSGKTKHVNEFEDRTERRKYDLDEDFNKVNFVGLVSLGIEKDLSKRLNLRFEPIFRYSFTPILSAPLKGYYYSFGANIVLFCNY